MKQRVTTGIRTGQTERRGTSRKSLRAPGDRAERRIFRNDYKLSVLAEYDRCSEPGEKGALLRREGLYSSIITDWRRQHREGILVVTEGRVRRRPRAPSANEVARLRHENERLKIKLAKAEAIIEVQEKYTRSWNSSPRARTTTTRRRHHRHGDRRTRRPQDRSSRRLPGNGTLPSNALPATPHRTRARAASTTTTVASCAHPNPGRRDR